MLQSENKDHFSPVEAGSGTELGNMNRNQNHLRVLTIDNKIKADELI